MALTATEQFSSEPILTVASKLSLLIVTLATAEAGVGGDGARPQNFLCGKTRVSDKTVKFFNGMSVAPTQVKAIPRIKFWSAEIFTENGCDINVCGSVILGPASNDSPCEFTTENTRSNKEERTNTSVRCYCQERAHVCVSTKEIGESPNWNETFGYRSVLFAERKCKSCYLPAINSSTTHVITKDNSYRVAPNIVRDKCFYDAQKIPEFAESKVDNITFLYTTFNSIPAAGAFITESMTFQCACGEIPADDTDGGSAYGGVIGGVLGVVLVILVAVGVFLWGRGTFPGMRSRSNCLNLEMVPSVAEVSNGAENEAEDKESEGLISTHLKDREPHMAGNSNLKLEILDEVKKLMEPFFVTMGPDWDKNMLSSRGTNIPDFEALAQEFRGICSEEYVVERTAFKIPPWNLETPLGSGKFGVVFKGVLKTDRDSGLWEEIAVKKMQGNTDMESFVREIENFQSVGVKEENIVRFIGGCCDKDGLFLLTELCDGGSMENHLLKIVRPQLYGTVPPALEMVQGDDGYFTTDVVAEQHWIEEGHRDLESQELRQLLIWCEQIAAGMQYLHETVKMLHVYLAVRNVLLREGNAKIADFGLSRKCLGKDYFTKSALDGQLPFSSFAPELLPLKEFIACVGNGDDDNSVASTSSQRPPNQEKVTLFLDIWAYGCLLWQMFRMGQDLYPDVKAEGLQRCIEITSLLADVYRHPQPRLAPDYIYEMMLECWNQNPKSRPRFSDLRKFFAEKINGIEAGDS